MPLGCAWQSVDSEWSPSNTTILFFFSKSFKNCSSKNERFHKNIIWKSIPFHRHCCRYWKHIKYVGSSFIDSTLSLKRKKKSPQLCTFLFLKNISPRINICKLNPQMLHPSRNRKSAKDVFAILVFFFQFDLLPSHYSSPIVDVSSSSSMPRNLYSNLSLAYNVARAKKTLFAIYFEERKMYAPAETKMTRKKK